MVKASLIDLSFLTEEERKRITEVLNRDAKIQQKEEARIRHLQNKAARTKNETIKKKIKMRSGEWFWELAGKQGGLKRSDTATASVRASLRIRQKETKKANKPTSSLTEVGGDISSDYNKTESRKNGFSVDVHQTNIATQDNRLGEADVSNTTESPEREQSSSTSRSSEKVTRQEAVDDRAILPSSEEHDESNEDSSYFVANHPYADSENTHQSFPLELSKGDGDGEMWNNSLSAERGIPSIVVKGPSVTDDVSERSSDRSSSRDYSSDSEHSYSSSDDKSSSGEDAPRTIAKEYYIDNVTTATKNDENKHEATSQEIITHHSSSADQKESEELFKPMPRAEAVAVVVANTITERTEDVSVHELSENDTASVKSEKYHSEEDEKSRRSSSSSSSSESRKSDAGDNVAEDILEDYPDEPIKAKHCVVSQSTFYVSCFPHVMEEASSQLLNSKIHVQQSFLTSEDVFSSQIETNKTEISSLPKAAKAPDTNTSDRKDFEVNRDGSADSAQQAIIVATDPFKLMQMEDITLDVLHEKLLDVPAHENKAEASSSKVLTAPSAKEDSFINSTASYEEHELETNASIINSSNERKRSSESTSTSGEIDSITISLKRETPAGKLKPSAFNLNEETPADVVVMELNENKSKSSETFSSDCADNKVDSKTSSLINDGESRRSSEGIVDVTVSLALKHNEETPSDMVAVKVIENKSESSKSSSFYDETNKTELAASALIKESSSESRRSSESIVDVTDSSPFNLNKKTPADVVAVEVIGNKSECIESYLSDDETNKAVPETSALIKQSSSESRRSSESIVKLNGTDSSAFILNEETPADTVVMEVIDNKPESSESSSFDDETNKADPETSALIKESSNESRKSSEITVDSLASLSFTVDQEKLVGMVTVEVNDSKSESSESSSSDNESNKADLETSALFKENSSDSRRSSESIFNGTHSSVFTLIEETPSDVVVMEVIVNKSECSESSSSDDETNKADAETNAFIKESSNESRRSSKSIINESDSSSFILNKETPADAVVIELNGSKFESSKSSDDEANKADPETSAIINTKLSESRRSSDSTVDSVSSLAFMVDQEHAAGIVAVEVLDNKPESNESSSCDDETNKADPETSAFIKESSSEIRRSSESIVDLTDSSAFILKRKTPADLVAVELNGNKSESSESSSSDDETNKADTEKCALFKQRSSESNRSSDCTIDAVASLTFVVDAENLAEMVAVEVNDNKTESSESSSSDDETNKADAETSALIKEKSSDSRRSSKSSVDATDSVAFNLNEETPAGIVDLEVIDNKSKCSESSSSDDEAKKADLETSAFIKERLSESRRSSDSTVDLVSSLAFIVNQEHAATMVAVEVNENQSESSESSSSDVKTDQANLESSALIRRKSSDSVVDVIDSVPFKPNEETPAGMVDIEVIRHKSESSESSLFEDETNKTDPETNALIKESSSESTKSSESIVDVAGSSAFNLNEETPADVVAVELNGNKSESSESSSSDDETNKAGTEKCALFKESSSESSRSSDSTIDAVASMTVVVDAENLAEMVAVEVIDNKSESSESSSSDDETNKADAETRDLIKERLSESRKSSESVVDATYCVAFNLNEETPAGIVDLEVIGNKSESSESSSSDDEANKADPETSALIKKRLSVSRRSSDSTVDSVSSLTFVVDAENLAEMVAMEVIDNKFESSESSSSDDETNKADPETRDLIEESSSDSRKSSKSVVDVTDSSTFNLNEETPADTVVMEVIENNSEFNESSPFDNDTSKNDLASSALIKESSNEIRRSSESIADATDFLAFNLNEETSAGMVEVIHNKSKCSESSSSDDEAKKADSETSALIKEKLNESRRSSGSTVDSVSSLTFIVNQEHTATMVAVEVNDNQAESNESSSCDDETNQVDLESSALIKRKSSESVVDVIDSVPFKPNEETPAGMVDIEVIDNKPESSESSSPEDETNKTDPETNALIKESLRESTKSSESIVDVAGSSAFNLNEETPADVVAVELKGNKSESSESSSSDHETNKAGTEKCALFKESSSESSRSSDSTIDAVASMTVVVDAENLAEMVAVEVIDNKSESSESSSSDDETNKADPETRDLIKERLSDSRKSSESVVDATYCVAFNLNEETPAGIVDLEVIDNKSESSESSSSDDEANKADPETRALIKKRLSVSRRSSDSTVDSVSSLTFVVDAKNLAEIVAVEVIDNKSESSESSSSDDETNKADNETRDLIEESSSDSTKSSKSVVIVTDSSAFNLNEETPADTVVMEVIENNSKSSESSPFDYDTSKSDLESSALFKESSSESRRSSESIVGLTDSSAFILNRETPADLVAVELNGNKSESSESFSSDDETKKADPEIRALIKESSSDRTRSSKSIVDVTNSSAFNLNEETPADTVVMEVIENKSESNESSPFDNDTSKNDLASSALIKESSNEIRRSSESIADATDSVAFNLNEETSAGMVEVIYNKSKCSERSSSDDEAKKADPETSVLIKEKLNESRRSSGSTVDSVSSLTFIVNQENTATMVAVEVNDNQSESNESSSCDDETNQVDLESSALIRRKSSDSVVDVIDSVPFKPNEETPAGMVDIEVIDNKPESSESSSPEDETNKTDPETNALIKESLSESTKSSESIVDVAGSSAFNLNEETPADVVVMEVIGNKSESRKSSYSSTSEVGLYVSTPVEDSFNESKMCLETVCDPFDSIAPDLNKKTPAYRAAVIDIKSESSETSSSVHEINKVDFENGAPIQESSLESRNYVVDATESVTFSLNNESLIGMLGVELNEAKLESIEMSFSEETSIAKERQLCNLETCDEFAVQQDTTLIQSFPPTSMPSDCDIEHVTFSSENEGFAFESKLSDPLVQISCQLNSATGDNAVVLFDDVHEDLHVESTDEADQSPLLQQPSPAYDISQGNNPYKDVVSEFQGLLVQKKLVEAEKSTDSESDPEKRSQSPSLPCSIEENETVSCVNQTEAVQDFTNQIEATETSINPSGIVSQFDEKNFIPDENVKEIITYTSSVEEPFVHIDFVLESSQDESVEVCTTPAEIMEESTPDSETEDKRSTPSTSDSDTGETTTDSETEDKSSNVAEIVKESTSDSETEKKSSTPSESVEENATETEEKNTTPADRIEETTSDSETEEKSSMPAEIVKESASDSETEKRSSTPSTSVEESTSDSETEEKSSIPAEIVKESASDSEKKSSTPSESVEENASETEEKSTTPTFTIEEITSDSETEEKSSISAESVRENEYHSIIVEECTAQDHSAKESTPQYEFVLENATQCETEKESGTQDETAENTMSLVETAEDSTIHDETSQRNPAKDDVAKQSLAEHSEESFAHVVTTINISATTESDEEAYTRTDTAEGSETHVLSRVSPSSVEVQDEGEASPIPVVETNQASTRIPSISVDETDKRESTPRKERNVSESGSDTEDLNGERTSPVSVTKNPSLLRTKGSLGKSTPILTSSLSLKPHFGSSWSVHSSAGAIRSDIEITGHVELSFDYAHKTGTFNVNVGSCKDLASADKKKLSNPYVKTYLLPDKNSKRKTKAKKKTLNPEYNETLKYTISESQLQTRTLNVAVWHDKVGVNVFLGEVNIDLSMHDVNSSKKMKIYYLQPKYDESNDTFEKYLGEINIALRLSMHGQSLDTETSEGELEIVMKNVSNVSTDLSNHNIYVKSYFLPDKAHATKQKTPSMPAKNKIDFDHLFMYTNVRAKELDQRCVELTIWQQHKFGANNLLGGVRVGSGTVVDDKSPAPWMDCTFEEVDVWKKMKQKVGQWVEGHLNLRTITPSK